MLYTVEQASKELNISKQAIYKQLKKEEFKQFVIIEKGIKHINAECLKSLKGENIKYNNLELKIQEQKEEIRQLKEEKKKLLVLLEQQNNIILNSQELQKKALSNTELLLLEKRDQLKRRSEEYENKNNRWFKKFKLKFIEIF